MSLNLVFLGAPGAGKGSVASRLFAELKTPHLSPGDMFRAEIRKKSALGKKIEKTVSSGALVDDELVAKIIEKRLKQKDCKKGFILDGFPRTMKQVKLLDKILSRQKKKLDAVVLMEIPEKELIRRLSGRRKCGECGRDYNINTLKPPKKTGICDDCGGKLIQRADDRPETVKKRLKVYEKQTKPLISHYLKKKLLKKVKGVGTIEGNVSLVKKVLGVKK